MTTDPALVLTAATLRGGEVVDVRIADGRIEAVGPPGTVDTSGETLDLAGYLLLPAPAEPHAHYDTALTADVVTNTIGDLPSAIDAWMAHAGSVERRDYVDRARRAALTAVSNGATAIRTHVGLYRESGLTPVEALLQVRDELHGVVDLQIAALTIDVIGPDFADMRDMLRAAMSMGVDIVGGCPHIGHDPAASTEFYLALAADLGKPLDLHTDETLEPDVLYLRQLARRVTETGFDHGVTASHCVSLGMQLPEVSAKVAAEVAAAGVAVVCNPQTNLFLQARGEVSAPPRGLTAVRPLLDAGATVAGGADNLRDPFNVLGRADPLETGSLLVTAGHLTPDEAYDAVSAGARAAMGLPTVTVEAGYPAELLAVEASSIAEALANVSSRLVLHEGRVVSRTTVVREFPDLPAAAIA